MRAGLDAHQTAFEIHALILALHYEARFLRSPDSVSRALRAFDSILARCANSGAQTANPVSGDPVPPAARSRKKLGTPA